MAQKILIAEDDVILREILMDKIGGAGYQALGAGDGQEAIDIIKREKPDLVLLDITIPIKNGIEVLAEMRADASVSGIPVVAISNSDDAESIKQTQALGVQDFLIKAIFDSGDVLEKVKRVLSGQAGRAKPIEVTTPKTESSQSTGINTTAKGDSSPSNVATQPGQSGKRVLIVEDDKFLREIASQKLSAEGFIVANATSGQETLDYLAANPKPDIVVLDLILPGMSGFEVLEKIKQSENLKSIPVIILSNLGQEEDVEKAKKLGAVDYLVKAHFSFAEIIKKIREITG